jgi:hypothetical protein
MKILAEGNKVLIRTVTMAHLGEIVFVGQDWIELKDGGWLADTGRFSECLKNGTVAEYEKVPTNFLVARGGIIDVFPWNHDLPAKKK